MAMRAKHRSKFAALNRQWWRLYMSETFSSGIQNLKLTTKTTKKLMENSEIVWWDFERHFWTLRSFGTDRELYVRENLSYINQHIVYTHNFNFIY